jgi:hypothetical protein
LNHSNTNIIQTLHNLLNDVVLERDVLMKLVGSDATDGDGDSGNLKPAKDYLLLEDVPVIDVATTVGMIHDLFALHDDFFNMFQDSGEDKKTVELV